MLVASCGSSGDDADGNARPAPTSTTTTTTPSAEVLFAALCAGTLKPAVSGDVDRAGLSELSGLVASRSQPGVLWTHNDSGDGPRLYAIDSKGTLLASYALQGVTATDWEAIAIGGGPNPGQDYLYVGDIGDSSGNRQEVNILRVPEPNVQRSRPPKTDIPLADVENYPLRYPDRTRDAEALLVDPITNEVLLVHKSYSGTGEANVYRAPLVTKDVVSTLEQVGSLPLAPGEMVTDGDVSPRGDVIVIRTYQRILAYARPAGGTLEAALAAAPCAIPGPDERQGEAVAISSDSRALLTTSEGQDPKIYRLEIAG